MRKRNKLKKPIKYGIERVVLSETLPYEVPIIFSNRHFYNFLVKYKVKYYHDSKNSKITWKSNKDNNLLQKLLMILFGAESIPLTPTNEIRFTKELNKKIPFQYKIIHKGKRFRELSIPHPKNQIELISFYEEFKELMLYYSKQSPFSIRKPFDIAKFVYYNDSIIKQNNGNEDDLLEENGKEYKNLKHFFTYKKYSNIYKFYEDYIYHRAEKKYAKMFKFDIAKCFDSIYTHSISWAIYNKEYVKGNLSGQIENFADRFDTYMQNANYGETNGILIGPEVSRIFAEIILQSIDKRAKQVLHSKGKIHKVDYQMFRYVDDFFVFFNENETKDEVLEVYDVLLSEYKMGFNDAKTIEYEKPLITEITIAKSKIVELLSSELKFSIKENKDREDKESIEEATIVEKMIKSSDLEIRCNSKKLITEFKSIIATTDVNYSDIMNYTLVVVHNIFKRGVKKYKVYKKHVDKKHKTGELTDDEFLIIEKQEKRFTEGVMELLDFVFFLYNVSLKVNTTIKLVKTLSLIIDIYKKKYKTINTEKYTLHNQFTEINKEVVFKKIYDEITLVLDKSKVNENIQVETLYLLISLSELGRDYRLTVEQLIKYLKFEEYIKEDYGIFKEHKFQKQIIDSLIKRLEPSGELTQNINIENTNKRYRLKTDINYFVITVLLFYFKDIEIYKSLRIALESAILAKIKYVNKNDRAKYSELVLLLFDLVACPYLDDNFKGNLLKQFGVKKDIQNDFIKFVLKQKYWFIKWDKFNLLDEMNNKSALEPYS